MVGVLIRVTPLGTSAGATTAAGVAAGLVRYLHEGARPDPTARPDARAPGDGRSGVGVYYADSVEGPGRWLGEGATRLGLAGTVDPQALEALLSGRDPATGQRLVAARGSAGRSELRVGSWTRWNDQGAQVWAVADAAAAAGLDAAVLADAVGAATGGRFQLGSLPGCPTRLATEEVGFELIDGEACFDADTVELLRAAAGERPGPLDGDWLPLSEAAELAGVGVTYLRRAARNHGGHDGDGDPPRPWIEARRKGRTWQVSRAAVSAFVERRQAPAVRVGYDLTATTEKSVAVLALLSDEATSGAALQAFDAANQAALAYLDERAATARVGGQPVPTKGLTVASFLHGTSRALDPFPHRHNVALNVVETLDGARRTLDARALYRHAPGASAIGTARLRWELTRRLGVDWELSGRGTWEIAGVNDDVVGEFSTRRREVEDALAELAARLGRDAQPGEVDEAVLATRADKAPTSPETLRGVWRDRAACHGLDAGTLAGLCGRRRAEPDRLDDDAAEELFDWLDGPDGVIAQRPCFDRVDVLAAMTTWTGIRPDGTRELRLVPPAQLDELANRFLGSLRVIPLAAHTGAGRDVITRADGTTVDATGGERTYTTVTILARQQRILAAAAARGGVRATPAAIATTTADQRMSAEQAALVKTLCAGSGRVRSAVGRPGAGKTWTMTAVGEAFAASGCEVLGAAVKSEAARLLGAETGITTRTLAWYLERARHGRPAWGERSVLVVDEASTVSDADLDELLARTARTGTTVCLIGDPAQHTSVAAGGTWALLACRAPALTENRRQRDPVERTAIEAIRNGDIRAGLGLLADHGRITATGVLTDAYEAALRRWADHHGTYPIVCQTNRDRQLLNRAAQALLDRAGYLGPDRLDGTDDRTFAVGDTVVARQNSASLHVDGDPARHMTNGARGRVVAVHADPRTASNDRLVVDFDGIGHIAVSRPVFDHHLDADGRRVTGLDHGYAITSYSVQGQTLEASTSLVTPTAGRAEVYVDVTRGQDSNQLIAVGYQTDPEVPYAQPDERDPVNQIAAGLVAHGHDPTPLDIDPDAPIVARLRRQPLHRLDRALAAITSSRQRALLARAIDAREHSVALTATALPPAWADRRPDPVEIAAAAVHLDRYGELLQFEMTEERAADAVNVAGGNSPGAASGGVSRIGSPSS